MASFATAVIETESRFASRSAPRKKAERAIRERSILSADSPERVIKRLRRLGLDQDSAEALASGKRGARELLDPDDPRLAALERVIGEDDLVSALFLEAGARAARAVARIAIGYAGGEGGGYGTGSLVSPELLLTNHHVLPNAPLAAASRAEFGYQIDRGGRVRTPVEFALSPNRFFLTSKPLDYTLVAVEQRAANGSSLGEWGWNPLIDEEGKAIIGELVNVIQHPSGEHKQLALRENRIVDLLPKFVHYQSDTHRGSSGSPVFNDQWELVALHHSGVPKKDSRGNWLARGGGRWHPEMGDAHVDWIANEGVRVSRLFADIKRRRLSGDQRTLRARLLEPPVPLESDAGSAPPPTPSRGTLESPPTAVRADRGRLLWRIPLHVEVGLGAPELAAAGRELGDAALPPASSSELQEALAELERSTHRPYYDEEADGKATERYYSDIDERLGGSELAASLTRLLDDTHSPQPRYRPATLLYPWVDLHEDGLLRDVYSTKTFDPRAAIEADLEADRRRVHGLRQLALHESALSANALEVAFDALEAAHPYNCEHVVCQSWFAKLEPMRGDLHHLFACEWGCNSFRGNTPYFEFADYEEKVRGGCGKREGDRFEPTAGKGACARATLYFLLRYPRRLLERAPEVDGSLHEVLRERIPTLIGWHEVESVSKHERHRNAAIFEAQGNRNPLIDHSDWAPRIDFVSLI